jgi:hypothetical protein
MGWFVAIALLVIAAFVGRAWYREDGRDWLAARGVSPESLRALLIAMSLSVVVAVVTITATGCSKPVEPPAPMIVVSAIAPPAPARLEPVPNVRSAPPPPQRSAQYKREMTESARRVFGPGAPTATLAAQIHQESGWRPDARSPAGALGIAQFMPATADDMADKHAACAPANPFDPSWGFRCRDRYMRSRLDLARPMADSLTECERWTYALRAYNGGAGWVSRDRKLAQARGLDPDDPYQVATVNAGRSAAAFRENVEYAPKIHRLAHRYAQHGWGRSVCA